MVWHYEKVQFEACESLHTQISGFLDLTEQQSMVCHKLGMEI